MSSGSSGRYQSKIFNFFNQHSQRLTQKWENSFRNLQVATKWSVESLLYPLYQLFQPDELAGKRLQAKSAQPETPPPSDAPIQHILELVQNLPSAAVSDSQTLQNVNPLALLGDTLREAASRLGWKFVKNQPRTESNITKSLQPENTLQYHIPTVRGIAAQLENRKLVLVTNDNRILDVLTIQQQAKVTDRINSEVTEYRHFLKLAGIKNNPDLLPEINRILAKITGNKTSNITNIAESKITVKRSLQIGEFTASNIQSYPGKLLALLDQVLANLETKSFVPVKHRSQEIIQVAKNQFDIFLYGREQLEARGKIAVNADKSENQTLNISELIAAAINYFFGGRNIQDIDFQPTPEKLPDKPSNQVYQNSELPEADLILGNWLTWDDLFAILEVDSKISSSDLSTSLVTEITQQELLAKSKRDLFRSKKFAKVASNAQVESEIKNQRQIQPDWIETTATFLGYEKHPLEQILAWLDHVMLWLEMIFMNMIYFFKGLLQFK